MSSGGRTASGLVLGSVVSGLLAYALFAVVTHGLGAETASPLAVLWTYWAFAGAALTFPLQHWIARHLAAGRPEVVRAAALRVGTLVLGFSAASGGAAWWLREPLFQRGDAWFPALVVLVAAGSAAMGLVRGAAAGRRRFGVVAGSLVAENALRCLAATVLVATGVDDPVAYGLALVAGPAVAVLWPSVLRGWSSASSRAAPERSRGAVTDLSGSAAAQLVAQTVLTGAPVLLALLGGAPSEVTSLFAALALFRAPYLVALGAVPQLTVRVAARTAGPGHSGSRGTDSPKLRWALAAVAVAVIGAAAALGALLGPWLLRLVFGPTVAVTGATAAVLAVGCTLAVINLGLMVVALAQGRSGAVLRAWALAIAASAASGVALASQGPLTVVLTCFLVAESTALAALTTAALRRPQPTGL
jgi:hypothetical protein